MISNVSKLQSIISELRDEKAKLIQTVMQKDKNINELLAKVYRINT